MRPFLAMHLSRQPQPRYLQLAAQLREELRHLQPGDQLPGEVQLATRFAVNRHTLRRAIDELVSEGRVLRQQGRSTRVLARPLIYPLAAGSAYSESLSAQGHGVQARLLQRQLRSATAEEAGHLELREDAALLELHTLRLLDEQPVSLIRHRFCASRQVLLEEYNGGSLRQYLAERQLPLHRAFSLIGARLPTSDEADQLLMPRHAPLLTVLTLSHDLAGRPVELSLSTSRADRFQYQVAT
ncbi:phosphonate metabolism transcriptional regulator PhnF [Stutzerimonas zhaodongensis]|uniref:phosphonate metabolism transcriptional regulator PhnF n=1 Tax=Stutzerimonas zhaodongensis TaxID=1176257 RepID=UPI001F4E4060|nr:phosphonate metabolism transcriptional regulator PhnF [Stutzerimonas zhaodongensis]UNG19578.1 phosphonate metabolism transcriptional regulator PhnF [Stutzerimonas zhaodongensis]